MNPVDPGLTEKPDTFGAPPLGIEERGLRIRLYTKEAGDAPTTRSPDTDHPFVSLASGALPFRSFLGALEADGRAVVPHLAVLLSPNSYPGLRAGTPTPGATNIQMERLWSQALRSHAAFAAPGLAGLETRAMALNEPPPDVPRLGPLAFCRMTREYVEPVCPTCLGRLALCRDETLLRTSGLPSYAQSLFRYLYCPACAAEGTGGATFYSYSTRATETPAQGVRIRRRSELYRDLAGRIQTGSAPTEARHACFECPHRERCYPAGRSLEDRLPGEDQLYPLVYYEAFYLPLTAAPLNFREAAALLGGAAPGEASLAGETSASDPLHEAAHQALSFDRAQQFFFHGDTTGLYGLEVFYRKIAAFTGLSRAVRDLHEQARRPHLALSPDRVRGVLPDASDDTLPERWRLGLQLTDLISTAPLASLDKDHIPGEPAVWSVPYPLPEAWVPGDLSRIQSETQFMRLQSKGVRVETLGGATVARITAELTADGYRPLDHGQFDLVRISAEAGKSQLGRLTFAGRKTAEIPRGFLFEGLTGPLSPDVTALLDPANLPSSWSVEATIVHTFGPPADVLSLGLILIRLLLENDRQDGSRLSREVVEKIAGAAAGSADVPERERLSQAIRAATLAADPSQVLFREADRTAAVPSIPEALWLDTLGLAFRMATNIAGYSLCGRQDDYDAADPGGPMRRVVEELEMLAERARGGLVGSSGRNGVILEVCADFLADVRSWKNGPMSEEAIQMTMVAPGRKKGS